jgi:hypothetical protein
MSVPSVSHSNLISYRFTLMANNGSRGDSDHLAFTITRCVHALCELVRNAALSCGCNILASHTNVWVSVKQETRSEETKQNETTVVVLQLLHVDSRPHPRLYGQFSCYSYVQVTRTTIKTQRYCMCKKSSLDEHGNRRRLTDKSARIDTGCGAYRHRVAKFFS